MLSSIALFASLQIGPFFESRDDYLAVRPFYAAEGRDTDVMWPLFTAHDGWWRALMFLHWQENGDSYQFEAMPFWFNGRTRDGEKYAGLFPIYGRHPHILLLHDLEFALWPLWTKYTMPRRDAPDGKLTTRSVLFPLFSWRDDGAWSLWPLYGVNYQRESDHRYVLWPIVTWASYREDRDTAGAGSSWMVWPLVGRIDRERESQWLFLPPFFSWAETHSRPWAERTSSAPETRLRCPWPFVEWESNAKRSRLSIWPLYEHVDWHTYDKGDDAGSVTRFGWKLVELYDDEIRIFPFWTSRKDDSYFRLWPFCETETSEKGAVRRTEFLSLMPIRNIPQVRRNWSKFWTFYEREENPVCVHHSALWGIIRWRTVK